MKSSTIIWWACCLCSFLALPLTLVLYLYPAFGGCTFPTPPTSKQHSQFNSFGLDGQNQNAVLRAPFRLLALGDPQLEGDSSLPSPDTLSLLSLRQLWQPKESDELHQTLFNAIVDLVHNDVPNLFRYGRKRLDLIGNDYYLAHIYRTLRWWTEPTHVAVLGDLIGSQWVNDDEFLRRSWRYWKRVFRHAKKVDEAVMASGRTEMLGRDDTWRDRIINVAGNHDIGYAGDINRPRLDRFEREYGLVNWDVFFELPKLHVEQNISMALSIPSAPLLHLVVLNDMNLDGPVLDSAAQQETYDYLNDLISHRVRPVEDRSCAVILLTHIPLAKEAGICADGPYFSYRDTGIKEQNHLSSAGTKNILEGIYGKSGRDGARAHGLGRNGIILNGHDHEGCDVYHYTAPQSRNKQANGQSSEVDLKTTDGMWYARNWQNASSVIAEPSIPGLREITLRSMMGSFGGHAGLLSAWFNESTGEWHFEHTYCVLGTQHIWWAIHLLDLCTISLIVLAALYRAATGLTRVETGKARSGDFGEIYLDDKSDETTGSAALVTGRDLKDRSQRTSMHKRKPVQGGSVSS